MSEADMDTLADRFEMTIGLARIAEQCDRELATDLVVDVVRWVAERLPK